MACVCNVFYLDTTHPRRTLRWRNWGASRSHAICRAGAQVTVLEAASELGEIGAGIQMTPNISRLLIKWGVSDVIGENLVEFEELNMRRRDGTKIGYTRMMPNMRRDLGYP
jgi:salicylate hydroxylase